VQKRGEVRRLYVAPTLYRVHGWTCSIGIEKMTKALEKREKVNKT
jgi:hypothetical protein